MALANAPSQLVVATTTGPVPFPAASASDEEDDVSLSPPQPVAVSRRTALKLSARRGVMRTRVRAMS